MTRSVPHEGCRIHYDRRGAGPPVLFIQGVGVHGDAWLPQVDALASGFESAWFDNRGMGQSQPHAGGLTVDLLTRDALAVLDACAWPSAHIVGHSLGGLIAIGLAAARPERVRSLSLVCTFARGRDVGRTPRMAWLGLRTWVGSRRMRRRAFLEMVMASAELAGADREALAARLGPVFGHDLADHPPIEMRQLAAMRGHDATSALASLGRFPVLVVSAGQDPIALPRFGRALADAIPGARYVLLGQASHALPVTQPARLNELLEEHLHNAERGTRN